MTAQAIRIVHLSAVATVTLQAFLKIPVLLMTLITIHLGMGTGMMLHLTAGSRMTGQTHRLNRRNATKIYLQWRMGIVACGTIV